MQELDGQGKAMVVTGSREEAFRYHRAIERYIKGQEALRRVRDGS
jgi:hypothetical protein